jgi:hypothetical protein
MTRFIQLTKSGWNEVARFQSSVRFKQAVRNTLEGSAAVVRTASHHRGTPNMSANVATKPKTDPAVHAACMGNDFMYKPERAGCTLCAVKISIGRVAET